MKKNVERVGCGKTMWCTVMHVQGFI